MFLLVVVIASIIATYSAIPLIASTMACLHITSMVGNCFLTFSLLPSHFLITESAPTINESVEGDFVAVIYEADQQSYIGVFVGIVESDEEGLESFMEPSVTFK